jgi:hypothetical protein
MAKITITGGSDDLIEIDGDIEEEFGAYLKDGDDQGFLLAVSDGTLCRIVYDQDGIWRVTRLAAGSATWVKVEGDVEADRNDVVTLEGDVRWIVKGREMARAR